MDRNVITATVLIALIMLAWMVWFSPKPPAQQPATGKDRQEQTAEADSESTAREEDVAAAPEDSAFAQSRQGQARDIVVDTDLYRARFSTRGATLTSFVLKTYTKFDRKTPIQMVDTTGRGAVSLQFTTPNNRLVDTRALYFTTPLQGDTLRVGKAPAALVFQTQIGPGVLRQTYTFRPDSYGVDLKVDVVNAQTFMTREGYELVWDGGIPFTEGDLEDDARHTGAYARSGGEVAYIDLNKPERDEKPMSGEVSWVSVKNKFFAAVLMPPEGKAKGAELEGERTGTVEKRNLKKHYTARLQMPAAPSTTYQMYVGPLEFYRITDYKRGLYDMVDYGYDFFEWMTRPLATFIFIPVFTFLGNILGNFGLVVIVFSILVKVVLYPLTKSSYTSMAKMRELQPRMEVIKEKYADNPQKQQEAMIRMYKETGTNPLGACLPMLLQWPVLIALWQFFGQYIGLRQESFLWAKDLSAPDVILHLPFNIPFYGNFVAGFTLLMGLSMVVQMRIQQQPAAASNPQAQIMTYVFPIMIFMMFNRFAAALSLYYLVFNVVSALQQQYVNKRIEAKKAKGELALEVKPGPKGKDPKAGARRKQKS